MIRYAYYFLKKEAGAVRSDGDQTKAEPVPPSEGSHGGTISILVLVETPRTAPNGSFRRRPRFGLAQRAHFLNSPQFPGYVGPDQHAAGQPRYIMQGSGVVTSLRPLTRHYTGPTSAMEVSQLRGTPTPGTCCDPESQGAPSNIYGVLQPRAIHGSL